MSGLFAKFRSLPSQFPLIRGMISYAIIWPTSSIVQEYLQHGTTIENADFSRAARFGLFGSLFMAPVYFGWLKYTSRFFKGTSLKTAISRAAIEQVTYSPIAMVYFYYGMCMLELKDMKTCWNEVREKFWPTYKIALVFWPTAQTLNFYFVSEKNRIIFVSAASFVWTVYLAHMKAKAQMEQGIGITKISADSMMPDLFFNSTVKNIEHSDVARDSIFTNTSPKKVLSDSTIKKAGLSNVTADLTVKTASLAVITDTTVKKTELVNVIADSTKKKAGLTNVKAESTVADLANTTTDETVAELSDITFDSLDTSVELTNAIPALPEADIVIGSIIRRNLSRRLTNHSSQKTQTGDSQDLFIDEKQMGKISEDLIVKKIITEVAPGMAVEMADVKSKLKEEELKDDIDSKEQLAKLHIHLKEGDLVTITTDPNDSETEIPNTPDDHDTDSMDDDLEDSPCFQNGPSFQEEPCFQERPCFQESPCFQEISSYQEKPCSQNTMCDND